MSGRPAPPGRRGSVKKEAFKADNDTSISVEPVVLSAADRQKAEREAEMKQLMALRKKAQEEENAAAQREQEERKASAVKQRAEELNKNQEKSKAAKAEEEARAAKAAAKAEEEARAAKAAAKAEEEARAAKAAAKAEEEARAAKAAAKAEEVRLQKEAEEKEFQEDQARQQKAIEEQRRAREAEEAKRQAEQKEFLERQQQLEEQQRRMDEKLAQQKAAMAEAAANEERERVRLEQVRLAEAQERDRQRAEKLAAQQAAEQAEIARLKEEEAQKQEDMLAAQRREEAAHAEEVQRLEAERLAAAEEARKAEQAISEFENAALEEKKRRAEAQRKKREMFLNDLDSFSTNFEAKNQAEDEQIKAEQDKHYEVLAQQMKEVEAVKASVAAKEAAEKEQRAAALLAAAALAEQEAKAAADAAAREAAANTPPPAPVAAKKPVEESVGETGRGKEVISGLSSSLFATSLAEKEISGAPFQSTLSPSSGLSAIAEESEGATEETALGGTEELRVPTRIGSGKVKVKPLKPAPAAVIAERTQVAVAKYSEDEEEEGTGDLTSISNVLTLEERRKMTLQQKESWRAKQADLTEKRKDFHGVVTYTFDGVFSWQMYGSAEAVDETGANYTEYLMRCQWGTNFENMQPWIVAHRYKEFDQLDQALKRKFPRLEANMPKLPKKELFRSLSSEVVAERRAILEEYMSKVVVSMPSLMRSELMNDFLDITNRISAIRLMLLKESNKRIAAEARSESPPVGKGPAVDAKPQVSPISGAKSTTTAVPGNSKYGIEDPLQYGAYNASTPSSMKAMSAGPEMFSVDQEEEEPIYWSMDEAEEARAAKACPSLDEDALGHLENDIRALGQLLRKTDNKALVAKDSKFRSKYQSVSRRWPSLRATAVVGMGVDFTLIPRAMQAEEDLIRFVNEFRNIETAASMSGRMAVV